MDRERFLEAFVGLTAVQLVGCSSSTESAESAGPCQAVRGSFEVSRSETEWRDLLGDNEYLLLRQVGTEIPYTSGLLTRGQDRDLPLQGVLPPALRVRDQVR